MTEIEIKRDRDGIRYVRPYLGTNKVTGRPIRPYHRFPQATSDEEALELARAWLAEIAPAAAYDVTHRVGDLLKRYIIWAGNNGKSDNTVKTYTSLCRYAESISDMSARLVQTRDLDRLYDRLRMPKPGGAGLSNATVIAFHWFLSGAFGWMVGENIIDRNPVSAARKPKPAPHESVALEAGDFVKIMGTLSAWREMPADTAKERWHREVTYAAYIALNTGLRCGEVCALRRLDAQLHRQNLRVSGTVVEKRGKVERQPTTKGRKHRNVAITHDVCDHIRAHEAILGCVTGQRSGNDPLVTLDGSWLRPSKVSAAFRTICRDYGMPPSTTFHSLRHTHATWLLLQGVDIKTVSERLGHASVATTLSIYAHVLPGRDAEAAKAFERAAREAAIW